MAFILDPSAPPPAVGAAGGNGDLVKDSSTATFMADVIEASMEVPVIVDFWAPWCGPCKTLGPALEKAVRLAGGLVRLVKINVDENQDLAAQMNVRSVPSVFGFRQGRPVDGFAGAVPESQIKSFIERLTGGAKPPLEEALDMAREALDAGDAASASQVFAEILAHDPAHPGAVAGMIRCLVATGDLKEARQAVSPTPLPPTARWRRRFRRSIWPSRPAAPGMSAPSRGAWTPTPTTIRPASTWRWRSTPRAGRRRRSRNCLN
jgi:putative thioredoxin